jgi:hypothetical protein
MTTAVQTKSEYRNLPLVSLTESATNPRRSFDQTALGELADFVSGHKIGLLFRWPFCCRGRGEPPGNRRLPYVIGT